MDTYYGKMLAGSMNNVYKKGIATKILQGMQKLRNNYTGSNARRCIMELLQNARDTAYENQGVKVRITLDLRRREFSFEHNGRPFKIKDILSLINQVSGKGEDDSTIGQFGTGFASTFMLSERVRLQSCLSDAIELGGEKIQMPPKRFDITIDRSGNTDEEVLSSIDGNVRVLSGVDAVEAIEDYDRNSFNTRFGYELRDADSLKAAESGVRDLAANILYIMLFSDKLDQVIIQTTDQKGVREERSYQREEKSDTPEGTLEIRECFGNQTVSHRLCYLSKDGLTIAAECDGNRFLPFDEKTARVFIDFPLIGTEEFPFPAVVNCRDFEPTEPRDWISYVDNEKSEDARINRRLLKMAVNLFGVFLQNAVKDGAEDLGNVIRMPVLSKIVHREVSETFARETIYNGIYRMVEKLPIVSVENHTKKICLNTPNLLIPYDDDPEEKEMLAKVVRPMGNYILPDADENWGTVLKGYEKNDKVAGYKSLIQKFTVFYEGKGTISNIKPYITGDPVEGLAELIAYAMKKGQELFINQHRIFPNQKGQLCHSGHLKEDQVKDEELKDILELLSDFAPKCNLRDFLLDPRIYAHPYLQNYSRETAIMLAGSVVQSMLQRNAVSEESDRHQEACSRLMSWISENEKAARQYLAAFASEEGRMKLLTTKQALKMNRRAQRLAALEELVPEGTSLEDIVKNAIKEKKDSADQSYFYNLNYDVFIGKDEGLGSGAEFEEFCRKVGLAGEEFAFRHLVEKYESEGYIRQSERPDAEVVLHRENDVVKILRPDTDTYKQKGWDISVELRAAGEIVTDYYEVKTNTAESVVRNMVNITPGQFEMAMAHQEHYTILKAVYDRKTDRVVEMDKYTDLRDQVARRRLMPCMERLYFKVSA